MMAGFDVDLFVIGAGSGGVRAARTAAAYGARVAIAESSRPGGTCVNAGCIPKKLFYYAASHAEALGDALGYGWASDNPVFDWRQLLQNKNREIERLNGVYLKLLTDAGVRMLPGLAHVTGPHSVTVNGSTVTAERILVATGSQPVRPAFPGAEMCISSNEAFELTQLPQRIVIIGGGYIALEFAGIFQGLGVETSLVHRGPLLLGGFDDEIRSDLAREIVKKGVRLRLVTTVVRVERDGQSLRTVYDDDSEDHPDMVMYAIGRRPAGDQLGLETLGVRFGNDGAILTNEAYQTSVPSIYAIGDVTGRQALTPVAIAEAMALTDRLYASGRRTVDYANIPTCVFSRPNVAMVGLTEAEARARFPAIDIYRSRFRPLKHTLSGNSEKTLMKLVVDRSTDRVIGAHMLGADAGEIIQGIAIALQAGATKTQFDSTIGIHPTAAEEFVTMRQVAVDS